MANLYKKTINGTIILIVILMITGCRPSPLPGKSYMTGCHRVDSRYDDYSYSNRVYLDMGGGRRY